MYTYSTARQVVNQALEFSGFEPIPDDASYSSSTATDKYQRQAVLALDLMQRKLGIVINKRMLQRPFSITTSNYNTTGQWIYEVKGAFIIEGFKANSFFNVTTSGVYNQRLEVMTYERWRQLYPRPDLTSTAAPQFIVIQPDDGSGVVKVGVWPYPNDVYTIEGIGRLVVQPITAGGQYIVFPQHYEHILILKICEMLESKVNEGREASLMNLANEAIAEVMRDATGAYEEHDPIDPGFRLWGGRRESARDYNPATDIAPPYP